MPGTVKTLSSYLCGEWREGSGEPSALVNPASEAPLAETSTEGLDLGGAVHFARERGGPALRGLSFPERAALLKEMSKSLHERRDEAPVTASHGSVGV